MRDPPRCEVRVDVQLPQLPPPSTTPSHRARQLRNCRHAHIYYTDDHTLLNPGSTTSTAPTTAPIMSGRGYDRGYDRDERDDRGPRGGRGGGRGGGRDRAPPTTLFVAGFPPSMRAKDLAYEFERMGPLIRCDIPALKSATATPYAFIEYEDPRDADAAFRDMHGMSFGRHQISIQFAKNAPSANWRFDGPSRGPPPPPAYGGRGGGRDQRDDRGPPPADLPPPRPQLSKEEQEEADRAAEERARRRAALRRERSPEPRRDDDADYSEERRRGSPRRDDDERRDNADGNTNGNNDEGAQNTHEDRPEAAADAAADEVRDGADAEKTAEAEGVTGWE